MIKNNEKQLDCIKMKDNIQAQVYTETMKMTKTELLQYFNKNTTRKQTNTYNKTASLVATD